MSYSSISISATVTGSTTVSLSWSVAGASNPSWNWTISGSGTISSSSGTGTSSSGSGTANVTGLSPSTAYTWTISLNGAAGTGSATSSSVTTQATPTYAVSYDANSGSGAPATANYAAGATVTVGAAATRTGYTFTGWTASGIGTKQPGSTFTMPSSPVSFTAGWNINKYTVSWQDGGHGTLSFYTSSNVSYNTTVTSPLVSEAANYSFLQFNGTNGNVVGQNSSTIAITGDTTYTAQYQYSPPPSYPPAWSDNSLSSTVVAGQAYSDGVTATNMNYSGSYSVSSGSLPTGVSLNTSTGAVTGTPTVVGPYSFTITASNSYGSVSASFSWTVNGGWYTYKNGAWVASTAQKYDGSTWVTGTVYKYDGSQWLVAGY